jgi:hypothetical protein
LIASTSPPVSSSERRWVLIFALTLLAITTIPYFWGYSVQGQNWRFTGFLFAVEDGNSYIAKMLTGTYGAWLFRTPYTPFEQRGVIAFLPYLLLGKLASPPGLHVQLVVLFHLFRIIAGILVLLAIYDFISVFLRTLAARRVGLALAAVGGGLGWVLVLLGRSNWLGSLPLDFISPESFGFLMLFGIPHLSLARATFLWALVIYLRSFTLDGKLPVKKSIKIGLLWLVTALSQPLTALVMGVVVGSHLVSLAVWRSIRAWKARVARWDIWRRQVEIVFIAGLIPLPFMVYTALAFARDPYLRLWTSQNLIQSPHPLHYLISFGVVLPFSIAGIPILIRRDPWIGLLPIIWVVLLPILAYAPVNLQRRLPEGIWISFIVLALIRIERRSFLTQPVPFNSTADTIQGSNMKGARWMYLFLLALSIPSSLFIFTGGMMTAVNPGEPAFRLAEEVRAFDYLGENAAVGDVVLASYNTGNPLPAWAPVRVVIGHGPESARLQQLRAQVRAFFSEGQTESERLEFLRTLEISYMYWGPHEQMLGNWDPHGADFLEPIYQSGHYDIFMAESR